MSTAEEHGAGRHLTAADLATLLDRTAAGPAAERMRTHLRACGRCRTARDELAGFLRSDREATRTTPSEPEIARAWMRLRAVLPAAERQGGGTPLRLAASLLAVLLAGSVVWSLVLQHRLGAARDIAAWPNAQIVDLDPAAERLRTSAPGPPPLSVSSAAAATLLLHGVSRAAAPAGYELVVRGPQGELVLQLSGLQPTAAEYVTLTLPPELVTPGEYRLELTPAGGAGTPATTYVLSVAP